MANLEIDRPIDSTFKMVKAILRVRIRALKPYPYNNICHSSDSFYNRNLHYENDIYHFSDAKKINKKYHQINKSYFNDTCEARCS